jgi:hypothetical protein
MSMACAISITDVPERLAFLNRGQGWVVRKLKALLPTIRDETIHADLMAMLASHDRNISRRRSVMDERLRFVARLLDALLPRHPHLPPKGEKCYPCVRCETSPMSRVA